MPPLPVTLPSEATNLIDKLTRRKNDLADFQIPRLRDCKSTLAEQQRFASEVREDLDTFTRLVQSLDLMTEELEREREKREVRRIVEEFNDALGQLKKDTRAALLISKRNIDASAREELFRSNAAVQQQAPDASGEDILTNARNNVTQALHRTIGLMQQELERSVLSSQMLGSSTATLKSTTRTHDTVDSLLVTSKHLITALERSDWIDRLVIFGALAFFFLVVGFVLKQRVLDRGIRMALWWTRFVPDFSGDAALLEVLEKGEMVVALTTTASAAVITASMASAGMPGDGELHGEEKVQVEVSSTPVVDSILPQNPSDGAVQVDSHLKDEL